MHALISKRDFVFGGTLGATFVVFALVWQRAATMIAVVAPVSVAYALAWFSCGIAILFVSPFLTSSFRFRLAMSCAALLPGAFFFEVSRITAIGAAIAFSAVAVGLGSIADDKDNRAAICVRKSVRQGSGWIVFAFALIVSTVYYEHIRAEDEGRLFQRLSIEQNSRTISERVLRWMNPDFEAVDRERITVDEFLATLQQSDGSMQSKMLLAQSKKQLSDRVGRELYGNERIIDVLAEGMNRHVQSYFHSNEAHRDESVRALSLFLAVLLFVTLWSLGSLAVFFWRWMAALLFHALRLAGVLAIRIETIERETVVTD
jgi:hypothetical protein